MCRAVLTVLTTRASTQVNKDQPLCRKNRSISCLISESLLMKNNSKYLKCVSILEGDDANCQIEKGDFIIDVAGIHSLARRYPALGECQQVLQYRPRCPHPTLRPAASSSLVTLRTPLRQSHHGA
jgi:hypothetical protein